MYVKNFGKNFNKCINVFFFILLMLKFNIRFVMNYL